MNIISRLVIRHKFLRAVLSGWMVLACFHGLPSVNLFNPAQIHSGSPEVKNGTLSSQVTCSPGGIKCGSALTVSNQSPNPPILVEPSDNATGITLPPTLEVTVSDPDGKASKVTFYGRKTPGFANDDFRLVVFPDTQFESALYPDVYASQTTWIANNQTTQNIVFTTHVGDIVDDAKDIDQWANASWAMGILDAGNVPYSVGPGNHDFGGYYETFFGIDRFIDKFYYGGHYANDNYNNYSLFTADEMNFILINLQYAPTSAMLDWADALLKQYGNRRGIVVSHSILYPDDTYTPDGKIIINALKDNPNLFLMLCGHESGSGYLAQPGEDGHIINIMLADYQDENYGGEGYLRILRFSPASNRIYATTYTPFKDRSITTYPAKMSMPYDMTTSSAFQVIGTENDVASGSSATITWNGLENNTNYEWYTVADNGTSSTTSTTWSFSTLKAPPSPPTGINASDGSFAGRVNISWDVSSGASFYKVFRNTSDSTSGALLLDSPAGPPYEDDFATVNTIYWYIIKACNSNGCSPFSSSDSGYSGPWQVYFPLISNSSTAPPSP